MALAMQPTFYKKPPIFGEPDGAAQTWSPPTATATRPPAGSGFRNPLQALHAGGFALGKTDATTGQWAGSQRMSWGDAIRNALGVTDFAGSRKDPRFRKYQDILYGHIDESDPEQVALKQRATSYFASLPRAAGGAGGAGGGGSDYAPITPDSFIRDLVAGKAGPYDDAAISRLTGQAASARAADLANANEAAYLDSARSGTAFSPAAAAQRAANLQASRSGLAQDRNAIQGQAQQANFAARIEGLNQDTTRLQLRYQDAWNRAQNDTEREKIAREFETRMAELAQQKELAGRSLAAAGAAAGREQSNWIERFNLSNQREDTLYQRDLPIELLRQFGGWLG